MKELSQRTFSHGMGVAALTGLLASLPAQAEPGETLNLDSVMVTGEKVSRELKETASSVSVIGSKEIDERHSGHASVSEVINGLPNVIYTDSVGAPVIRGQDTQGPNNGANVFWGGTVPRATINLDGHYLNYNELYYGGTSAWDVDSIEVFRGPQTTSQGANAIAGAIIVNTKNPTFTPEAAYQAEVGSYNTKRGSFVVSGPLSEDFAGRLALDYSARDTYIDYKNAKFQSSGTDQDLNALDARAKLLWLPSSIEGLQVKYTFNHNHSNRPSQESASAPFHKLDHTSTTMPSWEQDTNTSILDIDYELADGLRLFNQSQYSLSSVERRIGGNGEGDADIRQKNASNETRLSFGDARDTFSGFTGIYVARTTSDESLKLGGNTLFDDTKENLGVFGELNTRLSERWTLTTGLRYQRDHTERSGTSPYASNALDYSQTFDQLLPKVSLALAVNPQWTVGGLVSRGYNPGGVSLNLSSKRWQTFKDEKVWNYELFTRANLLDDRLHLNGNLFYMDMKDAQYNIPVVISSGVSQSYTINAQKAHAYGAELSANYRVLDNLTLNANAGWLRTRIDDINSNDAYAGNEFARSPGYTLSFGPSWDITDRLNLNVQVRHVDGYYSDVANNKSYSIDGYTLTDARASYRFNDKVELYSYVKNVFDDRSPTYMQQNRGIGGIEANMTQPRTLGVGVKGSF
nr:TonB-dependent receptor [Pseudomonas nabeulensis]